MPENKRWSVTLIGDNLTSKKHLIATGNTGDYFGIPTCILRARRTVRAELGVRL